MAFFNIFEYENTGYQHKHQNVNEQVFMKRFDKIILAATTIHLFLTLSSCVVSNSKLFSAVQLSTDSTYGYTAINPLLIKNGDVYSSMDAEKYFLQRLATINDEKLIYVSRSSCSNPKYQSMGLENRFTRQSIGGGGGILDVYTFVVDNRGDTIQLYVNVYKTGTIRVPVGLKYNP